MRRHSDRTHEQGAGLEIRLSRSRLYRLPRFSQKRFVVGRLKSGDTLRIVAQDKNSLAPEGAAIAFELHPEHGFQWKGFCDATVDNILNGTGQVQTKTMQMEDELRRFLTQPRPAEEVLALAKQLGISERTLKIAKRNLGILSERRADQWLWRLPEQEGKGATP